MVSSYRELPGGRPGLLRWRQVVDADHAQLVIPDGAADVIVAADGSTVLVGPTEAAELVPVPAGSRLYGLRFRPGVVGAALGLPAAELRGVTVPLADVVPPSVARRLRAVALGRLAPERLELPVDDRVRVAVRLLRRGWSVDRVVESTVVSARQLRRLMLSSAGLGPKALQRVLRLQRFVQLAEVRGGGDLAGLAVAAGYVDQAHLSREVRVLTGHTPRALLRERGVAVSYKPGG